MVGEALVGDVRTSKGDHFRIRGVGGRTYVVEEIDQTKFNEADPTPVRGRRESKRDESGDISDTCSTDTGDQIDVMVVYTPQARDGCGGTEQIEATIYQAYAEANQSYQLSDINQRIRLVHVAEISYTEATSGTPEANLTTDRDNLKGTTDGNMDGVHVLRNTYGADIVVLITEGDAYVYADGSTGCGKSFIMETVGATFEDSAFSVVKRSCATGYYSFAHELGHVMGARHDWYKDPTNNSPYAFNHGHTQPAPSSPGVSPWRTIMAYNDACKNAGVICTRIQRWSNPNQTWNGDSTGVQTGAQQQDNRQTLNNTAFTVANFRCSKTGPDNVWMRDTWSDQGNEPEPAQAGLAMWQSPYIWVRNAQDATFFQEFIHQNPQNGSQNYVYVKMHNGGAAQSGTLKVFGARASTGLSWPTDWKELGSMGIGSFSAASTRIVEIPWTPNESTPDTSDNKVHYCLVAQWISTSDPIPPSANTTDLDANTRASNNIVWRNMNIIDLTGDSSDSEASFIVRNVNAKDAQITSLAIRATSRGKDRPAPSFLEFGIVSLTLDNELMKIWQKAGYRGTGIRRVGNRVTVTGSQGGVLEGLGLPPRSEARVRISFGRPKSGKYLRDAYLMDVTQSVGRKIVGGITYQIHTDRLDRFPPMIH